MPKFASKEEYEAWKAGKPAEAAAPAAPGSAFHLHRQRQAQRAGVAHAVREVGRVAAIPIPRTGGSFAV